MNSITVQSWKDDPIEPRIKPLVDAMNATGRIQTIASCEGHWSRYSTPYVYFRCSPDCASEICVGMDRLNKSGALTYYWGIVGVFNEEGKLGFRIQAGELEPPLGFGQAFWHFFVNRTRIDKDLLELTTLFHEPGKHFKYRVKDPGFPEINNGPDKKNQAEESCQPVFAPNGPSGILGSATGAWTLQIRSNRGIADLANEKRRQETYSRKFKFEKILADYDRKTKARYS